MQLKIWMGLRPLLPLDNPPDKVKDKGKGKGNVKGFFPFPKEAG
jgi:hypothetical protein